MASRLVSAVLILAVLGGGILAFVWQATAEPVKVARAQLEAINQNDYEKAYGYCSASLKKELSLDEYKAFLAKYSALVKTSDSTFSNRAINNGVVTLRGTLTGQQGQVTTVRFTLVKENDRWVVQGFHIGGSSED